MKRIFKENKVDGISSELIGLNFKNSEVKEVFENKLIELLSSSNGVNVIEGFGLMKKTGSAYNELSTKYNREILVECILEFITHVYDEVENDKTEFNLRVTDYDDMLEIECEMLQNLGSAKCEELAGELTSYIKEFDCEYDIIEVIEYNDSQLNIYETLTFSDVVKEEIKFHKKIKVNYGYEVGSNIIEILNTIFQKHNKEVSIEKTYLQPILSRKEKEDYKKDYPNIKIPEASFMVSVYNDEYDIGDIKEKLFVRIENDFEKATFWHHKDSDFKKEKEMIKQALTTNIGHLALRCKFSN